MTNKEHIAEYLKSDPIWEIFGVKSQEDFIGNYVTRGKFHKNVPKVIQKDYQLVEHLQFFSYYNYPLIDEAFGKSTRIFEASIDLKINALGIEKKRFEPLSSKIRRLEKYTSNELHQQWLHSKELRNMFAHPKAGRLMGFTLIKAFKHLIHMINSVFLQQQEILKNENTLKKIASESEHLKKGLFVMKYKNKRHLICSMIPYVSSITDDIEKSLWVFYPVYDQMQIKKGSDFINPIKLNLKNLKINKEGLTATVIETKETITISATEDNADIEKYIVHQKQMSHINLDLKENYWLMWENELNRAIPEFIYNHSWE